MEQVVEESLFLKGLEKQSSATLFQQKAFEKLLEMGLPTEKHELFRYLPLKKILARTFSEKQSASLVKDASSYIYPECKESALVFVDGAFDPSLSKVAKIPKGVVVLPLKEAKKAFGSLIESQESKTLSSEKDPFALLAFSLAKEPLFVYVPPRAVFESPLQIVHLVTSEKAPACPSIQLHMGNGSEIKVIETTHLMAPVAFFVTGVFQVFQDDRSRVELYRLPGALNSATSHFEAIRAHLKKECFLKTVSTNFGAETVRDDYQVYLRGEGGEVSLNGVWNLKESLQSHTHVRVDHIAERCQSLQLFKGVLADFSKSSFEGKIFVEKTAQKTNAFQLNNNLLLSERAESFSKPNLEIFADDVKASHGATVGPADEEQLFYMKTRGIPLDVGQQLLVQGYCQEVTNLLPAWLRIK